MSHLQTTHSILQDLFGPAETREFAIRFWDGSSTFPEEGQARFTLVLEHPGALRAMLLPPSEVRLAEAYIYGEISIEGDLEEASSLAGPIRESFRSRHAPSLVRRLLSLPGDPHLHKGGHKVHGLRRLGWRHSRQRDQAAVRFHYDLSNEFYSQWLDPRLVYSCAYFETGWEDIAAAQRAKIEHTCRKLRLAPGERLLDIGCGWGGFIIYAAQRFGVEAVGVTLSQAQADLARRRIAEAGLEDRCRVEIRDYRDLPNEPTFDKIVSIGMVEHVGHGKLPGYFQAAYRSLRPGGLFLNHGIVEAGLNRRRRRLGDFGWRRGRPNSFIHRYVFPDGRLVPASEVLGSAEGARFELRDVENLRPHYALTLRQWVRRLESKHDEIVEMVGESTYRIWRLYMAVSARGFATGAFALLQSLLARTTAAGDVSLPLTRSDLYLDGQTHQGTIDRDGNGNGRSRQANTQDRGAMPTSGR